MKSLIVIAAFASLACACTSGTTTKGNQTAPADDDRIAALEQRVDDVDKRLQRIEQLLEQAFGSSREPDPDTVYSVPIDGLPYRGADHAKVTVVMAYEYACGYCYRVRPTLDQLLQEYAGQLKIVYKPFIVHADVAVHSAMAVCAAHKQGKYQELSELIWEKAFAQRDLADERIDSLAAEAGLDMTRYQQDAKGAECLDSLRASVENLSAVGVGGTPTFFVNGRPIIGAQPIAAFRELVNEELAKADAAIAQGQQLEDYYAEVVVKSGKTSL